MSCSVGAKSRGCVHEVVCKERNEKDIMTGRDSLDHLLDVAFMLHRALLKPPVIGVCFWRNDRFGTHQSVEIFQQADIVSQSWVM